MFAKLLCRRGTGIHLSLSSLSVVKGLNSRDAILTTLPSAMVSLNSRVPTFSLSKCLWLQTCS